MNEAPYEEIKETVLAALAKDEKDIAFQTLRSAVQFDSAVAKGDSETFADAMALFARISQQYGNEEFTSCLLYTSPSPRDKRQSRMPSSA